MKGHRGLVQIVAVDSVALNGQVVVSVSGQAATVARGQAANAASG